MLLTFENSLHTGKNHLFPEVQKIREIANPNSLENGIQKLEIFTLSAMDLQFSKKLIICKKWK